MKISWAFFSNCYITEISVTFPAFISEIDNQKYFAGLLK
jgi:hypothetical protein